MAFSLYDEKIIIILGQNVRPLSINEIAKAAGISWITVKKHIRLLSSRGIIKQIKTSKRALWKLNLPYLKNG